MIMAARNLLDQNDNPSLQEIRNGLAGNLCRCTGYTKIYEAVELAAQRIRGGA
jgi:carbon-monoxide dehydrogenase small subunit